MLFEDVRTKYTNAVAASAALVAKIPRRNSLYNGDGKIINKRTKKEVQAECHKNIAFELIESQISNSIPEPLIKPCIAEDVQRALTLSNYLSQENDRYNAIEINDRAERGTLKNGYHFYHIEWDTSGKNNSGYGALKLTEYSASNVFVQAGISRFEDAEYIFLKNRTTCASILRLYGVVVEPKENGLDVCDIVICYYLNSNGDLGRTIFAEHNYEIISEDEYYELRRVAVCSQCGEPILNLDAECPVCGNHFFDWRLIDEELATQDIYMGDTEKNAQLRLEAERRGEQVDPFIGLEKIVSKGDRIPLYHIRELPVVMRVSISDENSIYGKSDIDMIEQNQDTLNRITTKEEENILKAGSFVTYPEGVKIPADDSTLKLVPISDPRLKDAFGVHNIQANMQQDDIYAARMDQYGRSNLGITESYQGKRDNTAVSGKAKELSAAQSAGRLESKQRMKVSAYGEIYRKEFKFLLAYADETQHYVKYTNDGDVLELSFNRYMFLKKNKDTGKLYWDDNFIIRADNASLISNKQEMWQVMTQQFMAGAIGNPQDPVVMKLYWSIMKQLQFPFAAAIQTNLNERANDLDPALKQFLLDNPQILQMIAQQMAMQSSGQQSNAPAQKTGQDALKAPEPANPVPPETRLENTPKGD